MLRAGHVIILCVVALLCFGVVAVTSAGLMVEPGHEITTRSVLTDRAVLYALLAAGAFAAAALLPIDALLVRRRAAAITTSVLFALCVVLLLLVYVPGIGRAVNGSFRWVEFSGFGFQPSEIAKWGLLAILAVYLAARGDVIRRFGRGLLPAVGLIAVLCGLVIREDLGTAVLMGAAAFVILFAAGARVRHLAVFAAIGLAVCILAVTTSDYRTQRVTSFLHPYDDPSGTGYHMIQSQAAIAAGEITGRGLGHGVHKFGYLPEDTTDFLFAIICEELGVAGAALVVSLYGVLVIAGWSVVSREDRLVMRLLGLGVLTTFGLQAVMNMMVVTGLAPTKGIALPLLSWGGSGWVMCAASLGLIVRMDRRLKMRMQRNGVPTDRHVQSDSMVAMS